MAQIRLLRCHLNQILCDFGRTDTLVICSGVEVREFFDNESFDSPWKMALQIVAFAPLIKGERGIAVLRGLHHPKLTRRRPNPPFPLYQGGC